MAHCLADCLDGRSIFFAHQPKFLSTLLPLLGAAAALAGSPGFVVAVVVVVEMNTGHREIETIRAKGTHTDSDCIRMGDLSPLQHYYCRPEIHFELQRKGRKGERILVG